VKKTSLLLGISLLALGACKKDSEPAPLADVRTSLLLAHNWKITAQTLTFNHDGKADVIETYAATPACRRDDVTKFNSDKSLIYSEGATSCSPVTLPQPGSWFFNEDQTILTLDAQQFHGPFQVLDLTDKTLQIRHTYTYRQDNHDYAGVEDYTFTAL
jgi:hypothetical protein